MKISFVIGIVRFIWKIRVWIYRIRRATYILKRVITRNESMQIAALHWTFVEMERTTLKTLGRGMGDYRAPVEDQDYRPNDPK